MLTGVYFLTFRFFCTAYLSFCYWLLSIHEDLQAILSSSLWQLQYWFRWYFNTSAILFNLVKVKSVSPYSILQYALVDKLSFSPICSCVRFFSKRSNCNRCPTNFFKSVSMVVKIRGIFFIYRANVANIVDIINVNPCLSLQRNKNTHTSTS